MPTLGVLYHRDMAPKYSPPSVEAILEAPEDQIRGQEAGRHTNPYIGKQEPLIETTMAPIRTSRDKQIDKPRRSTRSSATSVVNSRHGSKPSSKSSSSKRRNVADSRDDPSIGARRRHRRTLSGRSLSSSTPSSDEEDVVGDHRAVLAASRERLTSPSLLSTLTSLTTATDNSGGSSGSNSTITQASMSRQFQTSKLSESVSDVPISPAAPDPPDVFSFLERDSPPEDNDAAIEDDSKEDPGWLSRHEEYILTAHSSSLAIEAPGSGSSSASSSFHSDDTGSEPRHDNDTDRSTSPERSVKGEGDLVRPDNTPPSDPSAAKIASQILAAQHRQSMCDSFPFGTAQMPRNSAVISHKPSNKGHKSRASQHSHQRNQSHAEKLSITGYEALAWKLSSSSASSIKPIYRKFEGLNHRLLLHLQDELAELEEQLHQLDVAESQSRTTLTSRKGDTRIFPASRRAAAFAGGDLEWHKMELLTKISFKLSQYNQALASFSAVQALDVADTSSISRYRAYLDVEKPVVEGETKFLDMATDLVIMSRQNKSNIANIVLPQVPNLAVAIAVAILLPILTFLVIPGFVSRMTVVLLVASGVIVALIQSGLAGRDLFDRERALCAMIYGVTMAFIAVVVV